MNTIEIKTVECILIKHSTNVSHDERMNPIDFGGQRLRSQLVKGYITLLKT